MKDGTYIPYRKPNDFPLYIHRDSNHPPHVTRQLPVSINKRLNQISSNKDAFDNAKPDYEAALSRSKLYNKLTYEEKSTQSPPKKKRKRNEIWFTPPYHAALKTNLGKEFLALLDKHFPVNHRLHKLFNRRTVKVSYSCSENFETIIQNHNRKILAEKKTENKKQCNCRVPTECPLQNKCLEENIVYKATVQDQKKAEYVGMTTTTFKSRYSNHKKSFKNEDYQHETTLSTYVWDKKLNPTPKIKWSLMKKCHKYTPGGKTCSICREEKFWIIKGLKYAHCINKKSDIGKKCTHKRDATFAFLPP